MCQGSSAGWKVIIGKFNPPKFSIHAAFLTPAIMTVVYNYNHLHPQSLLKLVKSARQASKQALDRLESRVLRPDKVKIEGVESGVRVQEGEERVKRKPRPHPPLEQSPQDAYWTSLAPLD